MLRSGSSWHHCKEDVFHAFIFCFQLFCIYPNEKQLPLLSPQHTSACWTGGWTSIKPAVLTKDTGRSEVRLSSEATTAKCLRLKQVQFQILIIQTLYWNIYILLFLKLPVSFNLGKMWKTCTTSYWGEAMLGPENLHIIFSMSSRILYNKILNSVHINGEGSITGKNKSLSWYLQLVPPMNTTSNFPRPHQLCSYKYIFVIETNKRTTRLLYGFPHRRHKILPCR